MKVFSIRKWKKVQCRILTNRSALSIIALYCHKWRDFICQQKYYQNLMRKFHLKTVRTVKNIQKSGRRAKPATPVK